METTAYQFNEGTLAIPTQWRDESMNVFTFPDDTGGNLVINRTPLPVGIDDDDYYQQVIYQFRSNLKGYQENAYQLTELDNHPAHLLDYQWQTPEGMMYQLSLLQIRENRLLTFTYTLSQPFSPTQKAGLLSILETFNAA